MAARWMRRADRLRPDRSAMVMHVCRRAVRACKRQGRKNWPRTPRALKPAAQGGLVADWSGPHVQDRWVDAKLVRRIVLCWRAPCCKGPRGPALDQPSSKRLTSPRSLSARLVGLASRAALDPTRSPRPGRPASRWPSGRLASLPSGVTASYGGQRLTAALMASEGEPQAPPVAKRKRTSECQDRPGRWRCARGAEAAAGGAPRRRRYREAGALHAGPAALAAGGVHPAMVAGNGRRPIPGFLRLLMGAVHRWRARAPRRPGAGARDPLAAPRRASPRAARRPPASANLFPPQRAGATRTKSPRRR